MGLFDQRPGFAVTGGAVGQGVAERVQGHGVFRFAGDDGTQVFFHLRQVITLFGQHGAGVQQVEVVRVALYGLLQHLAGLGVLVVVAVAFRFDQE